MVLEAVQLACGMAVLFAMVGMLAAALWRMITRDSNDYDEKHVWFRRTRD